MKLEYLLRMCGNAVGTDYHYVLLWTAELPAMAPDVDRIFWTGMPAHKPKCTRLRHGLQSLHGGEETVFVRPSIHPNTFGPF